MGHFSIFILFIAIVGYYSDAKAEVAQCLRDEPPIKSAMKGFEDLNNAFEGPLNNAETYFVLACRFLPKMAQFKTSIGLMNYQDKVREGLSGHIPSSYLGTAIPTVDAKERQTKDFLELVGAKISRSHQKNVNMAQRLGECTTSPPSPACEPAVATWLESELPALISAVRHSLALATSSPDPSQNAEKNDTRINTKLDPLGSTKTTAWEPLTKEEEALAQEDLSRIVRNLPPKTAEGHNNLDSYQERRKRLLQARELSFLIYLTLMGIHPIMQNLTSTNPTNKEIQRVIQKTLKALKVESDSLAEALENLKKPFNLGRAGNRTYSDKVLLLMKYRGEVEEVLLEHPEYCGLALSLRQVEENKKSTRDVIQSVAFFSSFLLGPWTALAVGAGVSTDSLTAHWQSRRDSAAKLESRLQNGDPAKVSAIINQADADLRTKLGLDISAVARQTLYEAGQGEDNLLRDALGTAISLSPGVFKITKPFLLKYSSAFRIKSP
jgi:predicted nuclease of predicted toxin-antitoxin system